MKSTSILKIDEYFIYKEFIQQCKVKEYDPSLVLHRHHIIPKSFGGNDDETNIVRVSVEDHVICHSLFAKCFDENSFEQIVNKRAVNVLKRNAIRTTEEMIEHSKIYMGELNPFYGKHHTDETKKKLAESTTRHKKDKSYNELYNDPNSEKEKRSLGMKQYWESLNENQRLERCEKIRQSLKNKELKAHNRKAVEINGVKYNSIIEAANALNTSVYYIRKMIYEKSSSI